MSCTMDRGACTLILVPQVREHNKPRSKLSMPVTYGCYRIQFSLSESWSSLSLPRSFPLAYLFHFVFPLQTAVSKCMEDGMRLPISRVRCDNWRDAPPVSPYHQDCIESKKDNSIRKRQVLLRSKVSYIWIRNELLKR